MPPTTLPLRARQPLRISTDGTDKSAGLLLHEPQEARNPLATLFGVPFDTTTLAKRGAAHAPAAIRDAICRYFSYDPNWGVDLAAGSGVADLGDVDVIPTDVDESWERISTVAAYAVGAGAPLLVLGGDHGCTFPVLRGVSEALDKSRRLGVMNIDAHFDVRDSSRCSAGVPFRWMLERLDGRVAGRNFVELGAGGFSNTATYHDYLREKQARVITCREVHRNDLDATISSAFDTMADGTDGLWLSIDVDAIDASQLPGTAAPAVGGLSVWQVLEVVWAFGQRDDVVGMDVMEVCPPVDMNGASANVAAHLALTFLAARQRSLA